MPGWFAEWAGQHAVAFGLKDDSDLEMLLSWEHALPYGPQELSRATEWILAHPESLDQFRPKAERHLAAIHRAVMELRVVACRRQETSQQVDWGECVVCRSTGYVPVPRLEDVRGDEWHPVRQRTDGPPVYRTYLVACICALGRWKTDRRKLKLLSVTDYQTRNPCWREQVDGREIEQRREHEGLNRTRSPGPMDSLIGKIRERYQIKG